jgi:hypothetical protein
MELVCTACGDEGDATRFQMCTELPCRNEELLFGLRSREFERERITPKEI